jgi:hypothetical protein
MWRYRLTLWGATGCREGTFPLIAECDKDALNRGIQMLCRSDCSALEVRRDKYLLVRADRDSVLVPADQRRVPDDARVT